MKSSFWHEPFSYKAIALVMDALQFGWLLLLVLASRLFLLDYLFLILFARLFSRWQDAGILREETRLYNVLWWIMLFMLIPLMPSIIVVDVLCTWLRRVVRAIVEHLFDKLLNTEAPWRGVLFVALSRFYYQLDRHTRSPRRTPVPDVVLR